jgi:hypothetical protein
MPSANASVSRLIASYPLVRKLRSSGSPWPRTGPGHRCARAGSTPGGDQRMPGPLARIRQVHRGDPVGHLPGAAQVVAFDPGRAPAGLDLPGLIDRPSHQARRRPAVRPARSSPATANARTTPIAAKVSQAARLSSRCIRSGERSPARSASVHPLRFGKSLITAAVYLPACSHGSTRAKHGRSRSSSSPRIRRPSPAPILAAAAASDSVVRTNA